MYNNDNLLNANDVNVLRNQLINAVALWSSCAIIFLCAGMVFQYVNKCDSSDFLLPWDPSCLLQGDLIHLLPRRKEWLGRNSKKSLTLKESSEFREDIKGSKERISAGFPENKGPFALQNM